MRKQTKLVAVASAAALLAIGASMTSFAATGWVEEGGEWFFYDNDGTRIEDEWKKSGDKWFWLDSEEGGAMAIDKLVDDDDIYYVDSTGAMVTNTWVKVVNEDQDSEDDPAEYNYYYMQANGKAYKGDTTKFKTIDGKRYAFNDEGKMLYGWVDKDASKVNSDDWSNESAVYYCGNWDDGAMKTGWQKITVEDDNDDKDHWFYFKSNGEKTVKADADDSFSEKTINGKKYGFDSRGVMVYEWNLATGDAASASNWKYFSSPEDGARKTKGWFKVVAPSEDNTFGEFTDGFDNGAANDESEKWYYAEGDGTLKMGEIARIKGKYYAFAPDKGFMLNGLVLIETDGEGNIEEVWDDGVDADELDNIIAGDEYGTVTEEVYNNNLVSLYYFGNDADTDGAMKTGASTITLDGSTYSFLFNSTGGAESKGKGITGIDDGKYIYKYGMRIKAGSDDKYQVVKVIENDEDDTAEVTKIASSEYRKADNGMIAKYTNKDEETVKHNMGDGKIDFENCYLVNTSGTITRNKTAAKDGDEWYFFVDEEKIKLYANEKSLKPFIDKNGNPDSGQDYNLDLWDKGFGLEEEDAE